MGGGWKRRQRVLVGGGEWRNLKLGKQTKENGGRERKKGGGGRARRGGGERERKQGEFPGRRQELWLLFISIENRWRFAAPPFPPGLAWHRCTGRSAVFLRGAECSAASWPSTGSLQCFSAAWRSTSAVFLRGVVPVQCGFSSWRVDRRASIFCLTTLRDMHLLLRNKL